jgi:phosphohistidine phosphatase
VTDRIRRLVLLRHAKAERSGAVVDELRPLALRGRVQAAGVASSLRAAELVPDEVLCSAAIRARQTCELVVGGLGDVAPESIEYLDALYSAGVLDVLALARVVDDRVRTLLIVGHEPAMSATAARLAGPESDLAGTARVRIGIPTAAFAVIESREPWASLGHGESRLTSVVAPRS